MVNVICSPNNGDLLSTVLITSRSIPSGTSVFKTAVDSSFAGLLSDGIDSNKVAVFSYGPSSETVTVMLSTTDKPASSSAMFQIPEISS